MNTLYILRHADAEGRAQYDDDHDRSLTAEGERAARRLGRFLAATDQCPEQCITSTAVRARRTTDLVAEGGDWDLPLRSANALYKAQPADVLDEMQAVDPNVQAILLVGHEPAWSATVSSLLGSANVSLSPGTCVRVDTKKAWNDIRFGSGVLRWMVPPSLLREEGLTQAQHP
ncbi:MAG: hypothetical protein BRD55_09370 [Bacteroidetes bacterium SW_9_63_38]|nr:MAG: hypothetical protein BRD55_09370 [Bacteroidetes bacterium SW_9_63_38]